MKKIITVVLLVVASLSVFSQIDYSKFVSKNWVATEAPLVTIVTSDSVYHTGFIIKNKENEVRFKDYPINTETLYSELSTRLINKRDIAYITFGKKEKIRTYQNTNLDTLQTNYKLIIDSLMGGQSDLFNKTKMYISENITNLDGSVSTSDLSIGVIVFKGDIKSLCNQQFNDITYSFEYVVKFYHKDGRCMVNFSINPKSYKISSELNTAGKRLSMANAIMNGASRKTPEQINAQYDNIDISQEWVGLAASGITKSGFYDIKVDVIKKSKSILDSYKMYMKTHQQDNW